MIFVEFVDQLAQASGERPVLLAELLDLQRSLPQTRQGALPGEVEQGRHLCRGRWCEVMVKQRGGNVRSAGRLTEDLGQIQHFGQKCK